MAQSEYVRGASPEEQLEMVAKLAIRGSEIVRELMIYAGKDLDVYTHIDLSRVVADSGRCE